MQNENMAVIMRNEDFNLDDIPAVIQSASCGHLCPTSLHGASGASALARLKALQEEYPECFDESEDD